MALLLNKFKIKRPDNIYDVVVKKFMLQESLIIAPATRSSIAGVIECVNETITPEHLLAFRLSYQVKQRELKAEGHADWYIQAFLVRLIVNKCAELFTRVLTYDTIIDSTIAVYNDFILDGVSKGLLSSTLTERLYEIFETNTRDIKELCSD